MSVENLNWADLSACVAQRWSPGIGDPNLTGWLTVAAYLACAGLAFGVRRRAQLAGRERAFWAMIAGLMVFLAINKQLDLQSALTATGRCVAQLQGWYAERRNFQRHFIQALLLGTLILLAIGLYLMRKHLRRNGLAVAGITVVAAFVAVRAVSFHHFDLLISQSFMDLRFNFIFEIAGLVLISLNAVTLMNGPARPAVP